MWAIDCRVLLFGNRAFEGTVRNMFLTKLVSGFKNGTEVWWSLEIIYQMSILLFSMASMFSINCKNGRTEHCASFGKAFYLLITCDPYKALWLLSGFITRLNRQTIVIIFPLCAGILFAIYCVYICNPIVIQSQQDLIELLFIWEMFFSWIRKEKNLENEKSSPYLDLLLLIACTSHVWFIKVSPLWRGLAKEGCASIKRDTH